MLYAEDGYRLWLRYDKISNDQVLKAYQQSIKAWLVDGNSPTMEVVKNEIGLGFSGLLGVSVAATNKLSVDGTIIFATKKSMLLSPLKLDDKLKNAGDEGYIILSTTINNKKVIVVAGNTDIGVLYGAFHFLRLLQTQQNISNVSMESSPRLKLRLLNHWDNLDRTVERGYAGFSLWDWHKLPDYIDARYYDYARANASIGINGTVLTNVNANALILTPSYLEKVKALADVLRPYGIKVFLTARFSAPVELRDLETADPLDEKVRQWWKDKAKEIYSYVPDFGGFVVKANSEGQPGPQKYDRNHADGANMLADALAPHKGVVMWRAFVYDDKVPDDRAKQAYNEFKPLDGVFRKNVLIQVKNGPIDFQPREPFHPMFGTMPKTPLMMEFQITQEYLGQATNLVYMGTLFKECLDADTYAKGKNSTVAKVIDGTLDNHELTGMCGVSNIGNDRNWCGHPFAQSNWYAFGRLAWDHQLSAKQIADEWTRMTYGNSKDVTDKVEQMMMASREIVVDYMTPLGLHHIMGEGHHYGPAPWVKNRQRDDWSSVYYHKADSLGVGFERTSKGSDALSQYADPVNKMYENLSTCPEEYLLWFHHVPWTYKTKSGKTLWDALVTKYYKGVDSVRWMQKVWNSLDGKIDDDRFKQVKMLLAVQEKEAVLWRNACLLYFQTFSRMPIPGNLEQPEHDLEYYMKLRYPYAPGIRPRW
jgi:alpha-glucuronidase